MSCTTVTILWYIAKEETFKLLVIKWQEITKSWCHHDMLSWGERPHLGLQIITIDQVRTLNISYLMLETFHSNYYLWLVKEFDVFCGIIHSSLIGSSISSHRWKTTKIKPSQTTTKYSNLSGIALNDIKTVKSAWDKELCDWWNVRKYWNQCLCDAT